MENNSFAMDERLLAHITHILSALTILSCVFLKVPQIMYVRERKSADGMYVQAILMEIAGFSIMTLYNMTNNYNLTTYMEYPIILLQVYILLYFVVKYNDQLSMPIVPMCVCSYVCVMMLFMIGWLPMEILSYLVPFCTPLSGFAKLSYMYAIIEAGNAEVVSLTTWVISMTTNLARVFTIYMDSADKKLMANFFISSVLSSSVLITAVYYKLYPRQPLALVVPTPPHTPPPRRPIRRFASQNNLHD